MADKDKAATAETGKPAVTDNSSTGATTEVEGTEAGKPAEVTTKESYSKEEYADAVKEGIAEAIAASGDEVSSEVAKREAVETALAESVKEVDALKEAASTSENDLALAKQTALYWELAATSKLDLEDLEPLRELPEAQFRSAVASIAKATGARKEEKASTRELFDRKDYTPPNSENSTASFLKNRYQVKG